MRAFSLAIVLAIAGAGIAHAAPRAGSQRVFETTVAPFDPSPYVMPVTFPEQYIKDVPNENKDRKPETDGAGGRSQQWYEWLLTWLRPWSETRSALDSETATFQGTVNKRGTELMQRLKATTTADLKAMNDKHGLEVRKQLQAYQKARADERGAHMAFSAAWDEAQAATKQVEREQSLVAAQADIDQKASVASSKAAIEKRIRESKMINEQFNSALGAAFDLAGSITDPAGFARTAIGTFTGAFLNATIDEHELELYSLDLRMEALDKAIDAHQHDAMTASLEQARFQLKAKTTTYIQRILEEQTIIKQESYALDLLADVENGARRSHEAGATNVLATLRKCNLELLAAGVALRGRCGTYRTILGRGPGYRAAENIPWLDRAITDVGKWSPGNDDAEIWIHIAVASRNYMQKQADWFPKEQGYVAAQMSALNDRVEVLPIDYAVNELINKL